jgi:hypothetical protein
MQVEVGVEAMAVVRQQQVQVVQVEEDLAAVLVAVTVLQET